MAPESGVVHRLHPASLPLELVRRLASFGFYAIGALFLAAKSEEFAYLLLLLLPIGSAILRYISFRYELAGDRLIVREGLFVKQVRQIPYARIQNLDTTQGPLHRILDVVDVRVQTAGGSEPEAAFQVISRARLEELRAVVFGGRTETAAEWSSEAAPAAESTPIFRMRASDLVVHGLLSQKGLIVVGGLLVAMRQFGDEDRIEKFIESSVQELPIQTESIGVLQWVVLTIGFLLLLQVATLAWATITLFGFRIDRRGDALHSSYGLLTRHETSLPRSRIQALHVKQSLFQRFFGRASVHAVSAGGVGGEDKEHARPWLVPACHAAQLPGLLAEIQPDTEFDAVGWRRVHPRAPRRFAIQGFFAFLTPSLALAIAALAFFVREFEPVSFWSAISAAVALAIVAALVRSRFAYRALGYARDERALYLRYGVLSKKRTCVRLEKIQSVRLAQSPLDRRARMATLSIDTAGPGSQQASFVVPFLPVREARRLARDLAREANRRDFRW